MAVMPQDGQVARVFQLRLGGLGGGGGEGKVKGQKGDWRGREAVPPWHMICGGGGRRRSWRRWSVRAMGGTWRLRPGSGSSWYMYLVNPYGEKPDHKSHLEGRVGN